MEKLENIIQSLRVYRISNEKYYKFDDLLENINCLCNEIIETEDYILTPYYILMGKRMELYEYELNIVASPKLSFERYLLDLTGKLNINDIPEHVVQRKKNCYIECERADHMIKVDWIKSYIRFLLYNTDLRCQVEEYFGFFKIDNMFFAIY